MRAAELDPIAALEGVELIVFDKDGTLIEFDTMWGGWLVALTERLEAATGTPLGERLYKAFGFDPGTDRPTPGSRLSAMPMARLRELAGDVLAEAGLSPAAAIAAVGQEWHAPDPVALARPLAPLAVLFGSLRRTGRRVAIATIDDRPPTEATLRALGVRDLIDGLVCADDGLPIKPAPDMFLHLCRICSVEPARCAMIGDSPADLAMARAAGAGLVIGVLSGIGSRAELGPLADAIIPSIAALLLA